MAKWADTIRSVTAAMDDVATFRANALPQMASTILELDKISAEAEKSIKKLEEGNRTNNVNKMLT